MNWSIPSGDLITGATMLLKLEHRLLPAIESAFLTGDGAVLGLRGAAPVPIRPIASLESRRSYLVRLEALLAYLRFCGLGLSFQDLDALGSHPSDPRRPALARPPVPLWRSVPAAEALTFAASRLSGHTPAESRALSERRQGEPGQPALDGLAKDVIELSGRESVSFSGCSLFFHWQPRGGWPEPVLRDCAGLVYPAEFEAEPGPASDLPLAGIGRGGGFSIRGKVRRGFGDSDFVELRPAAGLSGRTVFETLQEAGHVAGRLSALLEDPGVRSSGNPGRSLSLVAFDMEGWDSASLDFWKRCEGLHPWVARYEVRAQSTLPWTPVRLIRPRLGAGEVSSLVWFPFESSAEAQKAWSELSEKAAGEAGRFVSAFESLSWTGRRARGVTATPCVRRNPVLKAAAVLDDEFTLSELAVVAGREAEALAGSVAESVEEGTLEEVPGGHLRLSSSIPRESLQKAMGGTERQGILGRVQSSGLVADKKLRIAMRLDPAALPAARDRFRALFDAEDWRGAFALLGAAPESDPVLGSAWRALVLSDRFGDGERATRAAACFEGTLDENASPHVEGAGKLLARYRHVEKALSIASLVPASRRRLFEMRVLLEANRNLEALALVSKSRGKSLDSTHPREVQDHDVEWLLAAAEALSRCGEYAEARSILDTLTASGGLENSGENSLDFAFTSGYLYSDLGEHSRAEGCFRLAKASATTDRIRAMAALDIGGSLMHLGRFEEARQQLEESMALFVSLRDSGGYISALANRGDLFFREGCVAEARRDLERVLDFDGVPGREYQWLFSVPTMMAILLTELELEASAGLFQRAASAGRQQPGHPAWREILIVQARGSLLRREPHATRQHVLEAAKLTDNRMQNETSRIRLWLSSLIDAAPAVAGAPAFKSGQVPSLEESGITLVRGSRKKDLERAERLWEWAVRFPAAFELARAGVFFEEGARAASLAGCPALSRYFETRKYSTHTLASGGADPGGPRSSREFVCEDEETKKAFELARRVAPSSMPVLITGETGTGKEILAREIHGASGRPGPNVALNVAALTDTLLESELFGHARGAFTGAEKDRAGLVETAGSGTLFLDEIGELPLALQAKLLRLLQEKEYRRLGETRTRTADFRLISATHQDLASLVRQNRFRQDLYFRIAGVTIELPPLRRRPRDLARLIDGALSPSWRLSPRAETVLMTYSWPGNIRELMAALESARLMASPGNVIDVPHLPSRVRKEEAALESSPPSTEKRYFKAVADAKRKEILAALLEARGNRTAAAKLLGLTRQALLYEMKKLGIGQA
ncbi:MAG: sigma 54-interacting transcriptional regulator [Thermoanaerobaculia bacterium]|nr:sigma 54-interacting transcriptional regulator [Thermoanaerobaculia bacterium]